MDLRYWLKRDKKDWILVTWVRSLRCKLPIVLDPERGEYPVDRRELTRQLPYNLKGRKAMCKRHGMPHY